MVMRCVVLGEMWGEKVPCAATGASSPMPVHPILRGLSL